MTPRTPSQHVSTVPTGGPGAGAPWGPALHLEAIVADSAGLLTSFLADSTTTCCLVVSGAGTVWYANGALDTLLGQPAGGATGQAAASFLTDGDVALAAARDAAGRGAASTPLLLKGVGSHGARFVLRCRVDVRGECLVILGEPVHDVTSEMPKLLFELNNQLAVTTRETTRQKREFEQSHWQLTKIGEILPMCVECTRVQTADATWEDVQVFFQRHSKFLSHGYCPDCATRLATEWGLP